MAVRRRLLTFRSGGWVLLLAAALSLAAAAWRVVPILTAPRSRAVGDGRNAESYGFDLSSCTVPRDRIAASGLPKDGVPALVAPRAIAALDAGSIPGRRGKYLVGSDRVVGISIGGETRAYPLRVLAWHEVVNDTLGGVPIAVTYNPLSEGVAVFDRRVAGEVREFAVSGLLYNSTLLMYDRRPRAAGESLFGQLQARAVAGPAAALGTALETLPYSLLRWADWRAEFPSTTVLAPEDATAEKYQREPYKTYFDSERLLVPVDPLPPSGGLPLKARVLAVAADGRWRIFPLEPDPPPSPPLVRVQAGDTELLLDYSTRPASFRVSRPGAAPLRMFSSFWFAWFATHADRPGTVGIGD